MSNLISLLILLQTAAQLLALVQSSPSLPENFRKIALDSAAKTILLVSKSLAEETKKNPPAGTTPTIPPPTTPVTIREKPTVQSKPATVSEDELSTKYKVLPSPTYDLEKLNILVHDLINKKRSEASLTPLVINPVMSQVAKAHSEDQRADVLFGTDMEKPCSYPIIRHEGLTDAGISAGQRIRNSGIVFRQARENIAAISGTKNLLYVYIAEDKEIGCPDFTPKTAPAGSTDEEKKNFVLANREEAKRLLTLIPKVKWVNKEWLTEEEVAEKMVNAWMNSPGHRDNILASGIEEDGLGTVIANDYFITTHVFIGR